MSEDEKTRDAQIDLVSRKVAESVGIPGHSDVIATMAKSVLSMLPKWHVIIRCNGCKYTGELVVQSYDDENYNRRFYEDFFRTHKHPVIIRLEKVSDTTEVYTERCADCKRQHVKMDKQCKDQPKNAPRIGPQ